MLEVCFILAVTVKETGKEKELVMRGQKIVMGVLLAAAPLCLADDATEKARRNNPTSGCDSVCQLKNQDMAFALLIETFRQFRSCQIETDFQTRLRGADKVGSGGAGDGWVIESTSPVMLKLREYIKFLAGQERELRMGQIQTQVVNFENAYRCLRRVDEQTIGVKVPSAVDRQAASQKLKEYVIIAEGPVAAVKPVQPKALSAQFVLYDAEPAAAFPSQMTEACE